jgi:hypothetical protein
MTAPDRLPPVTFRRTISQRVLRVYGGLASVVLGGLALVVEPPILPPPLSDDGAADGEIKIRTLKGRSFALPAPAPAESLGRNPEFRRQLDTIRIYWRSAQ